MTMRPGPRMASSVRARWNHVARGAISPARIVPSAPRIWPRCASSSTASCAGAFHSTSVMAIPLQPGTLRAIRARGRDALSRGRPAAGRMAISAGRPDEPQPAISARYEGSDDGHVGAWQKGKDSNEKLEHLGLLLAEQLAHAREASVL